MAKQSATRGEDSRAASKIMRQKQEREERAALARARIERKKAKRSGLSRAQVQASKAAEPSQPAPQSPQQVLDLVNKRLAWREARSRDRARKPVGNRR